MLCTSESCVTINVGRQIISSLLCVAFSKKHLDGSDLLWEARQDVEVLYVTGGGRERLPAGKEAGPNLEIAEKVAVRQHKLCCIYNHINIFFQAALRPDRRASVAASAPCS